MPNKTYEILIIILIVIFVLCLSLGGIVYMHNDYKCSTNAYTLGYYGGYSISENKCVLYKKVNVNE